MKQENATQPDAFKEACLPLIKYLKDNYHPHVMAIVDSNGGELFEGLKTTGQVTEPNSQLHPVFKDIANSITS